MFRFELPLLVRAPLLQRAEVLLDEPASAVAVDDGCDVLDGVDGLGRHEPPFDRSDAASRVLLVNTHDVEAQRRRRVRTAVPRTEDRDGCCRHGEDRGPSATIRIPSCATGGIVPVRLPRGQGDISCQQRPPPLHHFADATAAHRRVSGPVDLQANDEATVPGAESREQLVGIGLAIHDMDCSGDVGDLRIDALDEGEPASGLLLFQGPAAPVRHSRSPLAEDGLHAQYPERRTLLRGNGEGEVPDEPVRVIATDPPHAVPLAAEEQLRAVVRDEHRSCLGTPRSGGRHVWLQDGGRRDRFVTEEPVRRLERSVGARCLREALVGRLGKLLRDSDEPRRQPLVAELCRFDLATSTHGEGRSHPRGSAPDVLDPESARPGGAPGGASRRRRYEGPVRARGFRRRVGAPPPARSLGTSERSERSCRGKPVGGAPMGSPVPRARPGSRAAEQCAGGRPPGPSVDDGTSRRIAPGPACTGERRGWTTSRRTVRWRGWARARWRRGGRGGRRGTRRRR